MLRAGYENIFRHPARFLSIRVYDEKTILHTCLLAITCTLTLVLALRVVEVIAESHTELATRVRYNFHGTDTAIGNGPK